MSVRMSRKTKRAIQADEAVERYFLSLKASHEREMMRRFRLAEITLKRADGVNLLLQIQSVYETPNGIRIEVA
jgi:hypothetical protein